MEIAVAGEEEAEHAQAWRPALTAGLRFHSALVATLGSSRIDGFFRILLAQLRLAWAEASEDDHLEHSCAPGGGYKASVPCWSTSQIPNSR